MEQAQLLMKGSASAAVRHRSLRYRTSMDITPQATNMSIDLSIMGQLKWRLRRRKNVSNQGTMIIQRNEDITIDRQVCESGEYGEV